MNCVDCGSENNRPRVPYCHRCGQSRANKRWRETHPERHKASFASWAKRNPDRQAENARRRRMVDPDLSYRQSRQPSIRFANAKGRARTRGIDWTLSFDEWRRLVSSQCHYCSGGLEQTGCGLDRVDNDIGYHSGNVVPCCGACNNKKHQRPYEQMIAIMRDRPASQVGGRS